MNPIQGIPIPQANFPMPGLTQAAGAGQSAAGDKSSFANVMLESLSQVNKMQQDADAVVEQFFTGGDVNPGQVLTAVQKADMSFRMMLQMRNKLVSAWQKIEDIRI